MNALNAVITEWAQSASDLRIDIGPDATGGIGRTEVAQADLDGWALILGDALQNFRACLDQLVWRNVETAEARRTCSFPIFESEAEFQRSTAAWWDALPERLRTIVEQVQPYRQDGPAGWSPLVHLRWLSNRDKHRTLHLLAVAPRATELTIRFDGPEGDDANLAVTMLDLDARHGETVDVFDARWSPSHRPHRSQGKVKVVVVIELNVDGNNERMRLDKLTNAIMVSVAQVHDALAAAEAHIEARHS